MSHSPCIETLRLRLLGDASRIRRCSLWRAREHCVSELVPVTGISQRRVSTQLGRLRDAVYVRDRRQGPQTFYALSYVRLPKTAHAVLDEAAQSGDATLASDLERLSELEAERSGHAPSSRADEQRARASSRRPLGGAVPRSPRPNRAHCAAPYGERQPGFHPDALGALLTAAALRGSVAHIACRETKNHAYKSCSLSATKLLHVS